jgi:hypothetical protein
MHCALELLGVPVPTGAKGGHCEGTSLPWPDHVVTAALLLIAAASRVARTTATLYRILIRMDRYLN